MNKLCTDISQSKKLMGLGVDINTADMHHVLIDSDKEIYDVGLGNYIGILPHYPAWSLAALLDILPSKTGTSSILIRDSRTGKYKCVHGSIFSNSYEESIDAVFELVCQLLENKEKL